MGAQTPGAYEDIYCGHLNLDVLIWQLTFIPNVRWDESLLNCN